MQNFEKQNSLMIIVRMQPMYNKKSMLLKILYDA